MKQPSAGDTGPEATFHPGKGKRSARTRPKGRMTDPEALKEVRSTLGNRPRRRDLLVEHLHTLQDLYGGLSLARLAALAEEMKLSLVEVYEVASFYPNFNITRENGETGAHPIIRVCDSLPCMLRGSRQLFDSLTRNGGAGVRVVRAACMGRCEQAPVARSGATYIGNADPETVTAALAAGNAEAAAPEYRDYDSYTDDGGYRVLSACREGVTTTEDIVSALDRSGLRGLGGAGFPAGRKWRLVAEQPGPRLMAVNGDESEPGTFKDRHYLLTDPHRMLEGMLIGAWSIEAEDIYIYVRDEFPEVRAVLERELTRLSDAGLIGGTGTPEVHLRRGTGSYICGEESAMLESIEGKRGLPRHRPPFPAQVGLFGRPTLVNNVETLYWVRDIIERGPGWFASQGINGCKGLRTYSVSGRVREPGIVLAPAGTTVRQLIDEHCGGMASGHAFKAYLPGGASGGILPQSLADLPLDFGTLEKHGCFIGSAAIIVLSDHDDIRDVVLNLTRFFENESCGQCTPCRSGTEKAASLMAAGNWDAACLEDLAACLESASICGLGQAAANPIRSAYRYFPEEMK